MISALVVVAAVALAAIGAVVWATRAALEHGDRAAAADVRAAKLAAEVRIADGNTAAAQLATAAQKKRGDALERILRARSLAVLPVIDDDHPDRDGFDLLLRALDAAAGHADVRAGDGGGGPAGADRLRADRGPDAGVSGDDSEGPATVPGA